MSRFFPHQQLTPSRHLLYKNSLNHHQQLCTSLHISTNAPSSQYWNWRLTGNMSLLIDPDFISYFNREWDIFLQTSDLPETPLHVLWETAKVVMRGKIISYSCQKKKKELA